MWTTAQSTTYTPVVVYGQTSSTQEPDQANGSWIYGMNDSEDGVQTTAANHEAPIDPSDMNGTESWVSGLMHKLKELFSNDNKQGKTETIRGQEINSSEDFIPTQTKPNIMVTERIIDHQINEQHSENWGGVIIPAYDTVFEVKIIDKNTNKTIHADTVLHPYKP